MLRTRALRAAARSRGHSRLLSSMFIRRPPPPPFPLVLTGHAASLTPYQSDTPRPSPRRADAARRRGRLFIRPATKLAPRPQRRLSPPALSMDTFFGEPCVLRATQK